jgi:hypothetical protein
MLLLLLLLLLLLTTMMMVVVAGKASFGYWGVIIEELTQMYFELAQVAISNSIVWVLEENFNIHTLVDLVLSFVNFRALFLSSCNYYKIPFRNNYFKNKR